MGDPMTSLSFFESLINEKYLSLEIEFSIYCQWFCHNPRYLAILSIYYIVLTDRNDWMRDVVYIMCSLCQKPVTKHTAIAVLQFPSQRL